MRCEVGGAATTLLGGFSGASLLFIAIVPELEKSIGARFCGTGVAYGLPVRCPPCCWPLRLRMRCLAGPPVPVKGWSAQSGVCEMFGVLRVCRGPCGCAQAFRSMNCSCAILSFCAVVLLFAGGM